MATFSSERVMLSLVSQASSPFILTVGRHFPFPAEAGQFIHPADAAALENLKAIPLFNTCVSTFLKFGLERFVHGVFLSKNIRLSERQLPAIYKHLPPSASCSVFACPISIWR